MTAILLSPVPRGFISPARPADLDAHLTAAQEAELLSHYPSEPDPFLLLPDSLTAMGTPVAAFGGAAPSSGGEARAISPDALMAIFARAMEADAIGLVLHHIAADEITDTLAALDRFAAAVAVAPGPLVTLLTRQRETAIAATRKALSEAPPGERPGFREHPHHSRREIDDNWRAMQPHRNRALARLEALPQPAPQDVTALWQDASASGAHATRAADLPDRPGHDNLLATFGLIKAVQMLAQAARFGGQGLLVVQN